jgi:hypothetical protein
VWRWDVESGRLLARAVLPCANRTAFKGVWGCADSSGVVVGECQLTRPNFPNRWYLHDAFSGRRLTGPIPGLLSVTAKSFSPDGRWFFGRWAEPRDGGKKEGVAIVSTATGDVVATVTDREELLAETVAYSPDGTSAAVFLHGKGTSALPLPTCLILQGNGVGAVQVLGLQSNDGGAVQVVDLPSGKGRQWLDLPKRLWSRIRLWNGQRVEMVANSGGYESRFTFDLTRDPVKEVGENAAWLDRSGYEGPGWQAHFDPVTHVLAGVPGSWYYRWIDPLLRKAGILPNVTYLPFDQVVRIVDPRTGVTRYKVPRPVRAPFVFSHDGRRMACSTGGDAVEVWDTDPSPRWPWAAGAGIGGVVFAVAIGRGSRWIRRVRP